jgi:hypothetical protein
MASRLWRKRNARPMPAADPAANVVRALRATACVAARALHAPSPGSRQRRGREETVADWVRRYPCHDDRA